MIDINFWEVLRTHPYKITMTKKDKELFEQLEDINYHTETLLLLAEITNDAILINTAKFIMSEEKKQGGETESIRHMKRMLNERFIVTPQRYQPYHIDESLKGNNGFNRKNK